MSVKSWQRVKTLMTRNGFNRKNTANSELGIEQKDHYQYEQLTSVDCTRILLLQPGAFDDPIVVSLQEVPLHLVCAVKALSYVWGDSPPTHTITCNEKILLTTPNLKDALRGIRRLDERILLWVDAICVNQNDLQERSQQVKHMAHIYSTATNVLVWLGSDSNGSMDAAFGFARQIATDVSFSEWVLKDAWESRSVIQALKTLSSQKWFSRMWTMQEIGLASSATFISGNSQIDWDTLLQAYDHFRRGMSFNDLRLLNFTPEKVVFLRWKSSEKNHTFLELLEMVHERETTDPRDRIFALLSHPAAQVMGEKDTRLLIEPDYTKSLDWVYSSVAERLITDSGYLDVLSHVRSGEVDMNASSWAPAWHKPRMSHSLLDSNLKFSACGTPDGWFGSPRFENRLIWNPDAGDWQGPYLALQVQCGFSDVVAWRLSFPMSSSELHPCIKACWELVRKRFREEVPRKFVKRFGDILTCGRLFYHRHQAPQTKQSYFEHFSNYWRYLWGDKPEADILPPPPDAHNSSCRAYFTAAVEYACKGRALFYTEKGYLGLGPSSIELGDRICVLQGGKVPYAIRKPVWDFKLVGECYVPGLMQGEMIHAGCSTEEMCLL